MADKSQPEIIPEQSADRAPSLWLYAGFLIIAVVLTAVVVSVNHNVSDFLLNLSTEIIGAILILWFIERRIRQREIEVVQEYARNVALNARDALDRMSRPVNPQTRFATRYARELRDDLLARQPGVYFARPEFEGYVDQQEGGFALVAPPGMGKTVILYGWAISRAFDTLRSPGRARIPVFIRGAHCQGETISELAKNAVRELQPMPEKVLDRWLHRGRVLFIIDGIDEALEPRQLAEEIVGVCKQQSASAIVISSRSHAWLSLKNHFEACQLEEIVIPSLSEDEVNALWKYYDDKRRDTETSPSFPSP